MGGSVQRENTDLAASANWEYGVLAGIQQSIDSPIGIGRGPWFLSLNGGVLFTNYDEANMIIDPGVTRQDREKRIMLQIGIPLVDRMAFMTSAQYRNIGSNLPNFEYNDTAVTVGALWNF